MARRRLETRAQVWAVLFAAVLGSIVVGPAAAQDAKGWVVSAGGFDFVGNDKAVEAGVGFRFRPLFLNREKSVALVPAVGVSAQHEGSAWVYGAVRLDWEVSDGWYFTPTFGVSIYEEGDGKDLGGPIEFRSGIELSRRLRGGSRVGILFYHLSNSRIYELNPGEESLVLTWSRGR